MFNLDVAYDTQPSFIISAWLESDLVCVKLNRKHFLQLLNSVRPSAGFFVYMNVRFWHKADIRQQRGFKLLIRF